MISPFRVTLLQLKSDLSAATAATDKVELGPQPLEEIFAMAGKLQKLDLTAQPKLEPAIIVYRGEKGWRIVTHRGMLRVHESTSSIDDYWTVDSPKGLTNLPPFRHGTSAGGSGTPANWGSSAGGPRRRSALRSAIEVVGLLALGVVLIAVGLWYGVPHKRLTDVPANVVVVTASPERESLFGTVAGTYATGKKPGDAILVITAEGRVSLGAIGKDGKPITPPRIENEQAKAGRRDQAACVITSFGIIAAAEPNAVKVGRYRWQRTSAN
jgi:hypothetical protein